MSAVDIVELDAPDRLFIGGEWEEPSTSAAFEVLKTIILDGDLERPKQPHRNGQGDQ